MIETIHTVAAFVIAIALLIAVHEFGHFIVARKLGIKVEKFSIGFGPALFSWHSKDREVLYVIAAIPLGGYVKMLGENPDEQGNGARQELSEEDKLRAFDAQPIWKRACVAIAGPGFNFLFAIVTYMLVGWLGQSVLPPIVGHVAPASVAEQAGFVSDDKIIAMNGGPIHSWQQMEDRFKDAVGQPLAIQVERGGGIEVLHVKVPVPRKDPLLLDVASEVLGIDPGMHVLVAEVMTDAPAAKAGLKPGDVVLQVQDAAVASIGGFIRQVRAHAGQPVIMNVRRGREMLSLAITPESDDKGRGRIGARMMAKPLYPLIVYRMGPLEGLKHGFTRTWEVTALTFQVLGKMLTAAISPRNLGGPIAIAQIAGKTAALGFVAFISFLALISVNLGVLNLLPVPVLDGGHLLYLSIEKVRGTPLSPRMMERTQMVGMVLIAALMIFAFYNDIARWLGG
ncbi:MAG: RIP metalloprotease RseP [Mariprofundaceae bacterium]|nr:RIP metalloprotease RseP [Mariprofundaceae bacterium]